MSERDNCASDEVSPFEHQVLATLQVHSFLLTALIRGQFNSLSATEVDEIIESLHREFATLELPENARTDEKTLQAISDRHAVSQRILEQMLEFARPR
ncbi:MAG: hypothetical protein VX874_15800 [Pseudomonadota bacterium]|nr:hypothetical protein [Pseudomonadota bacterium]